MELPYWDPILFMIIDNVHFAYLGLLKTHLEKIWFIDSERNGGDGLHPSTKDQIRLSRAGLRKLLEEIRRNQSSLEKLLMKETKSVLWSLCFELKLCTGARVKHELVNQILQWVSINHTIDNHHSFLICFIQKCSTSKPEDVPVIPAVSYDRDPVRWEDTTAQPAPSSMDEFRVSKSVYLASFFQPIIDYPKIPAVKSPFPIDVLVIQSFISFKSLVSLRNFLGFGSDRNTTGDAFRPISSLQQRFRFRNSHVEVAQPLRQSAATYKFEETSSSSPVSRTWNPV